MNNQIFRKSVKLNDPILGSEALSAIKKFAPEVYKKLMREKERGYFHEERSSANYYSSVPEFINDIFTWRSTEDGHTYWKELHDSPAFERQVLKHMGRKMSSIYPKEIIGSDYSSFLHRLKSFLVTINPEIDEVLAISLGGKTEDEFLNIYKKTSTFPPDVDINSTMYVKFRLLNSKDQVPKIKTGWYKGWTYIYLPKKK